MSGLVAVEVEEVKAENNEPFESFEGSCEARRAVESRLVLEPLLSLLLSDALSWSEGEQKKDDL